MLCDLWGDHSLGVPSFNHLTGVPLNLCAFFFSQTLAESIIHGGSQICHGRALRSNGRSSSKDLVGTSRWISPCLRELHGFFSRHRLEGPPKPSCSSSFFIYLFFKCEQCVGVESVSIWELEFNFRIMYPIIVSDIMVIWT